MSKFLEKYLRRRRRGVLSSLSQDSILTNYEKKILRDLMKLKYATTIQFEVETNRVGLNTREKFDLLEDQGWIKSKDILDGLESKVYYVSAKTLGEFRRIEKTEARQPTGRTRKKTTTI